LHSHDRGGEALFRLAPQHAKKAAMADSDERRRTRGALPLSALVGRVIGPVAKRRGFATADLIAAWPEIVGARFADCTRPDKIVWPRGEANVDMPGVLTLKVDGPRAVLVQHELGQILERVNAFLGYGAVGQVRIVQAPVERREKPAAPAEMAIAAQDEQRLAGAIGSVESPELRAALDRLGRGVLARKQA
jgi:hypothetical protein